MTENKKMVIVFFLINAAIFFFQSVSKNIYTPLLEVFRGELAISSAKAGSLITFVFLGYAIARFPSGVLTDIIGAKRTIFYSSFLMGIFLALVGLTSSFVPLAVLTFLMGVTTGLYVTAGYTMAVVLSKEDQETFFTALLEIFGGVSGLIAPLMVVLFVERLELGWQALFFLMGFSLIIINLVLFYLIRQESKEKNELNLARFTLEVKESVKLFKNIKIAKFILWSTLVGGFGSFAIIGFRSFMPSLLIELHNYSFSQANQLFASLAVIGLITKLGVAWLGDKFGQVKILILISALNTVFFIILTTELTQLMIFISLLILGTTFASHNTLINSYVLKSFPVKYRGRGFGLFSTLYTVIYSLGSVVTGFLADKFGLIFAMRANIVAILIASSLLVSYKLFVGKAALVIDSGRSR